MPRCSANLYHRRRRLLRHRHRHRVAMFPAADAARSLPMDMSAMEMPRMAAVGIAEFPRMQLLLPSMCLDCSTVRSSLLCPTISRAKFSSLCSCLMPLLPTSFSISLNLSGLRPTSRRRHWTRSVSSLNRLILTTTVLVMTINSLLRPRLREMSSTSTMTSELASIQCLFSLVTPTQVSVIPALVVPSERIHRWMRPILLAI
mmetsp:Transcript_33605/g.99049  ORF Transcript_33605/g.99049 Transcript_33605/m.99049 type:complete len:202 (-) Transcript_33605:272-877(-)